MRRAACGSHARTNCWPATCARLAAMKTLFNDLCSRAPDNLKRVVAQYEDAVHFAFDLPWDDVLKFCQAHKESDVEKLPFSKMTVTYRDKDTKGWPMLLMAEWSDDLFQNLMVCTFRRDNGEWQSAGPKQKVPVGDGDWKEWEPWVSGSKILFGLCGALMCKNISHRITDPGASADENARRVKKGKRPLQPTHTLYVRTEQTTTDKKLGPHDVDRRPIRQHLRRGHIRRLPKEHVWVRHALVGSKANGVLVKDYSVSR